MRRVPPDRRRRLLLCVLAAAATGVVLQYVLVPSYGRPVDAIPLEDVAVAYHAAALNSEADPERFAQLREVRLARITELCHPAPRGRAGAVLDSFPDWDDSLLGAIACRQLRVSMTRNQVKASWGPPDRAYPDADGLRPIERWVYRNGASVLFWDDRVRSWQ